MRWLLFSLSLWLLPSGAHALEALTLRAEMAIALSVEVADEDAERIKGMMHRTRWAPADGMLFIFDRPAQPVMWMKDTPLPMDMVFIAPDGEITAIHTDATPFSLEHINAPRNTLGVLELPAGFARKHALKRGHYVEHAAFN